MKLSDQQSCLLLGGLGSYQPYHGLGWFGSCFSALGWAGYRWKWTHVQLWDTIRATRQHPWYEYIWPQEENTLHNSTKKRTVARSIQTDEQSLYRTVQHNFTTIEMWTKAFSGTSTYTVSVFHDTVCIMVALYTTSSRTRLTTHSDNNTYTKIIRKLHCLSTKIRRPYYIVR